MYFACRPSKDVWRALKRAWDRQPWNERTPADAERLIRLLEQPAKRKERAPAEPAKRVRPTTASRGLAKRMDRSLELPGWGGPRELRRSVAAGLGHPRDRARVGIPNYLGTLKYTRGRTPVRRIAVMKEQAARGSLGLVGNFLRGIGNQIRNLFLRRKS